MSDGRRLHARRSLQHSPPLLPPSSPSLISVDERGQLLAALDTASPSVSAGGSAANTVRAVARLAAAGATARSHPRLSVGWAPVAGPDAQGAFHAASMAEAGVGVVAQAATVSVHNGAPPHATGTVVVLTTPDAQRTFLAHVESPPGPLTWAPAVLTAASRSRVLLVEGYLWELPGAEAAIAAAVDAARGGGGLVAMTAGDAGVCRRARATMLRALESGAADVLFANRAEAAALLGCADGDAGPPAHDAAAALGTHVGVAAVTDGANGAALSALGALCVVPPVWGKEPPVDINGAGDAFAAGALYGLLAGLPIAALGRAGARAAAAVIARTGAALTAEEADRVVAAVGASERGASVLPSNVFGEF